MKAALIVGLGSFIGGSLRYLSVLWIERKIDSPFPIGILFVNILGSFLIGIATQGLERVAWNGDPLAPLFLTAGIMGGFTTFSTFSLQTLRLAQAGHVGMASANALASVVCCLLSVYAGIKLGQLLFPST